MSHPGARGHIPVLPTQVLDLLAIQPGQVAMDGTAGLGGHASLMAERLGPTGTLVLMDLDAGNLERSAARIAAMPAAPRVITHHGSFAEAPHCARQHGVQVNAFLADLGFASNQVDNADRGLSFNLDGPLDMRLNPAGGPTAADLVNSLSERELAKIIFEFGEERMSRQVAAKIVATRTATPLRTTAELAEVVRSVVHRTPGGIDPATRTFQALRIAVNDELGHLDALLSTIGDTAGSVDGWLAPGANVAIIAFHSLEDRPVKQAMADWERSGLGRVLTHKPLVASVDEQGENPRSRSAKLRGFRVHG